MSVSTQYGDNYAPIVLATSKRTVSADISRISEILSYRANVFVGTRAQLTALTVNKQAGLRYGSMFRVLADDNLSVVETLEYTASGWRTVGARQSVWKFTRTNQKQNDMWGAGTFGGMAGGTIVNAPLGDYSIVATALVSADIASIGYSRFAVNGVSTGDSRFDFDGSLRVNTVPEAVLDHKGGDLKLELSMMCVASNATVQGEGTQMIVTYLGPRR